VSVRNTIGSPVAELREGMSSRFTATGTLTKPPFGTGSLGIEVNVITGVGVDPLTTTTGPVEKVDFGNEVDFFGDPVLALTEVGFHVFQTNENTSTNRGGARNMPNIRFEIDPNVSVCPLVNYSTMVWVPDPAPVTNQWSGYLDATTTGNWYFTNGCVAAATTCTQALTCNFTQAKNGLNDSGDPPIVYTVLVGKGRDNMWIGAVDGLRLNRTIYDFEADGVRSRRIGGGHHDDDDNGHHHDNDDDD
jgi:hypothetical protein